MSVTSLQNLQNGIDLISSDSSILFSQVGNNINIIASSQGSQGGVTSLNTLTGANFITSTGGSIVISTPVGFPTGHNINIEAVQGGVVGINTINNIASDGTHNFTVSGGGGITILPGTNEITIEGPNSVNTINSLAPINNDIELVAGSNVTITNLGNQITIASSGGVGGGIATINAVAPDGAGEFSLIAGGTIAITPSLNGVTITGNGIAQVNGTAVPDINHNFNITGGTNVTVVNDVNGVTISSSGGGGGGITAINGSTPPTSDFTLTAGSNVTLTTLAAGNIEISSSGGGGGVQTINSLAPVLGDIQIIGGQNISVSQQGANIIELDVSGLSYLTSINNSTPVGGNSNFTLTAGTGISLTTLSAGDIEISQSAAAVTEINGLFPSAGSMTIAVGAGLSISNSGNTITLDSGGAAGTPGFEYIISGTMTFAGNQVGNVTAPYTLYYSGVSPNQIATLQIGDSTSAVVSGAVNVFWTAPIPTLGEIPKYNQASGGIGLQPGVGYHQTLVRTTTTNILTVGLTPTAPGIGDPVEVYGMSITYPIVAGGTLPLKLMFANQDYASTTQPQVFWSPTQTIALTQPAYVGAPTVYNIASTTYPGGNCPTFALGLTRATTVSQFGGVGGSLFTQYTLGTNTQVSQVDVAAATGIVDLYTIAMCMPHQNDKCYALCFSASSNAHYIIDVFSVPLVDLNLSIPGPAMMLNSMGCSDTLLTFCQQTVAGSSVFRTYTVVESPSSITFLVDDTAHMLIASGVATFSNSIGDVVYYGDSAGGDDFYSVSASTLNAPATIYQMPAGYNPPICIGFDTYNNLLLAAQPTAGGNYSMFAFSITTQGLQYEIVGSWGAQVPIYSRPI